MSMSKKLKREWAFFIGINGRRKYNDICRSCREDCKQSFRAGIVECARYQPKRKKVREKGSISENKPAISGV